MERQFANIWQTSGCRVYQSHEALDAADCDMTSVMTSQIAPLGCRYHHVVRSDDKLTYTMLTQEAHLPQR